MSAYHKSHYRTSVEPFLNFIDFCNSLDYSYLNVSRTLCPEQSKTTVVKEIVVDVSTMNYYETRFELVAELEDLAIMLVFYMPLLFGSLISWLLL